MSSVIGVDIGGTKVAVAELRDRTLGESTVEPTECESADSLIDQLVRMIDALRGDDLRGVGFGVPSVVEWESGRAISSVNIPFANLPLRQVFGDRLGVPAFIDNDATVAALAEAHDEQLRLVARNLVILTIGTGVGGGIVINGRIYRGATGGAAELGHQIVGLDLAGAVPAPMGAFPQPGSLEFVASGHALDRLAAQAAGLHPESRLGRLRLDGKPVLGAEAVTAARDGDRAAERIVEIWGQRVGIGVANVINTFDPEEVVIGGGAAQAGELLLEPAKKVAAGYVLPGLGTKTTIRLARHGVRAGVLGAALLAEHELGDHEGVGETA
ncbi:MAG TPA: ROK family protein [Solirubrobacteraceae bacterium]|nr:ROK family protein [Solirubrobacteraceae bacterium]